MGEILSWAFEPINIRLLITRFIKLIFLVLSAVYADLGQGDQKGFCIYDALKVQICREYFILSFQVIPRMVNGIFENKISKIIGYDIK